MANEFELKFGDYDPEQEGTFTVQDSLGNRVRKGLVTAAQVQEASFKLNVQEMDTTKALRFLSSKVGFADDDKVSHEELNKEYEFPVALKEPMSRAQFEMLRDLDIQKKEYQRIIEEGTRDNKVLDVVSFATGAIPHILDPIGIITGKAVGSLVTKAATRGLLGAKFAASEAARTAAKAAGQAAPTSLGREVVENVVGNILSEATVNMPLTATEQQEVDVYNSMVNATIGGAGFPLAVRSLNASFGLGKRGIDKLFSSMESRLEAGKKPFGDDIELEGVTEARRTVLREEVDELLTKAPTLTDPKEIEATEARLREISDENAEIENSLRDEVGIRERANAPDQDMYYDAEVDRIIREYEDDAVPVSGKDFVDSKYEDLVNDIDDPEFAASVKQDLEAHTARRAKLPEAMRAISGCILKKANQ